MVEFSNWTSDQGNKAKLMILAMEIGVLWQKIYEQGNLNQSICGPV